MKLSFHVREERLASLTPFPYVAFLILCFILLILFGIFLPPSPPSSSTSASNESYGLDSTILPPMLDKNASPPPALPSSPTASAHKTVLVTASTVTATSIHAVTVSSPKSYPTSRRREAKSNPKPTPNSRPRPRPKLKQMARRDDAALGFDAITRKDQHRHRSGDAKHNKTSSGFKGHS